LNLIGGCEVRVCKVEQFIFLVLEGLLFKSEKISAQLLITANYKEVLNVIEEHGCFITLLAIIFNADLKTSLFETPLYFFHPIPNFLSQAWFAKGCDRIEIVRLDSLRKIFEESHVGLQWEILLIVDRRFQTQRLLLHKS